MVGPGPKCPAVTEAPGEGLDWPTSFACRCAGEQGLSRRGATLGG